MAKIIDPDNLKAVSDVANLGDQGTSDGNVFIDTTNKVIHLAIGWDGVTEDGLDDNLTTDGVTLQAYYSFLKEEWKDNAELIKFPFPMVAITPEQFEFQEGWHPASITTVNLFRDGGFAVKNTDATSSSEFIGAITLGSLGVSDQVYVQQVLDGESSDIILPGVVNQCIKVFGSATGDDISFVNSTDTISSLTTITSFAVGDVITISGSASNDGDYTIGTIAGDNLSMTVEETGTLVDESAGATITIEADTRSYFKIFVREQAKLYAQSELDDIGVTTFTYQAYRFPLANADDLKITHTDVQIDVDSNGVADIAPYDDMSITYHAAPVSRSIGGTSYNFDVIIDADVAGDGSLPTAEEIYEYVQWSLRQGSAVDIDAGAGIVTGKTAPALLKFVGDTLVTSTGVFIDDFAATDINRIEFYDTSGIKRVFPFVAAGAINFNGNLVDDSGAVYRMFFTDANGNNFGDTDALLVHSNDSVKAIDITITASSDTIETAGAVDFSIFSTGDKFNLEGTTSSDGYYTIATVNATTITTTENISEDAASGTEYTISETIAGNVTGAQVQFTFDYDGNVQGGRTSGADAAVTVVAIGLDKAQYVKATSTIGRSNANSVSLVASLERNYSNPV